MRIHHLNCGRHAPVGGALFDGRSRGVLADLCTHCLLIETDRGLVLVDTGYGLQDVTEQPHRTLPYLWPFVLNIRLSEDMTAVRQIEALGYSAKDVKHIVLTHLDFDHSGGLRDFPNARVHLLEREYATANGRLSGLVAHQRYRPENWLAVREWRPYHEGEGDNWNGFVAVRDLDGLPPEILLVPLAGHTAGHAGVAIDGPDGWLLHAGDAYLFHGELEARRAMPVGLALYERIMAAQPEAAAVNLGRLRRLRHNNSMSVRIFCSHDSVEFETFAGNAR